MMDPEINDEDQLWQKYEAQQKSMRSCAVYVAIYGIYFFLIGMCGVYITKTLFTPWTLSIMFGVLGIYGGGVLRNIIALEIFVCTSLISTFVLSSYALGYIMDHDLFSLLTSIAFVLFICINIIFISVTGKLIKHVNNPIIVSSTMTDCNQSYTYYDPGPSSTYR